METTTEYVRCFHCGEYAALIGLWTCLETNEVSTVRRCLACGVIDMEDKIIEEMWAW